MLSGVIAKAILPVAWLVMPRGTSSSLLISPYINKLDEIIDTY